MGIRIRSVALSLRQILAGYPVSVTVQAVRIARISLQHRHGLRPRLKVGPARHYPTPCLEVAGLDIFETPASPPFRIGNVGVKLWVDLPKNIFHQNQNCTFQEWSRGGSNPDLRHAKNDRVTDLCGDY
jgi:hypothetical protein